MEGSKASMLPSCRNPKLEDAQMEESWGHIGGCVSPSSRPSRGGCSGEFREDGWGRAGEACLPSLQGSAAPPPATGPDACPETAAAAAPPLPEPDPEPVVAAAPRGPDPVPPRPSSLALPCRRHHALPLLC
uniref:Uncharacterized protein n=1 Tax=Arundo donax TaxID=35708 RepID=A0A0A9E607_ARUDO